MSQVNDSLEYLELNDEGEIDDIFANAIEMREKSDPNENGISFTPRALEMEDLNIGESSDGVSNTYKYTSRKKSDADSAGETEYKTASSVEPQTPNTPSDQPAQILPNTNDLLSAIELLIDRKLTLLKGEFSTELEKVKQENAITQNIKPSPPKKEIKPQPKKPVTVDIDVEDENDAEEMKFVKKLCKQFRDENTYLKDQLAGYEQDVDSMTKAIEQLTKQNEDSSDVIHNLNDEMQHLREAQLDYHNRRLAQEEEQKSRLHPLVPRLPSIASPTSNPRKSYVDSILTKMEILPSNHLSKQNNPPSLFGRIPPSLSRSNTSPSHSKFGQKQKRPSSASLMTRGRRTSLGSTAISSNSSFRNSVNTQLQIQQLQQDPQTQQRLELMADRIMKSLRGAPPPDENYKEVDRMVEEIREQFEEKGIYLPLEKHKNCIYILGHAEPFKSKYLACYYLCLFVGKLHLNVIGGELVVRLGGGYQPFLTVLDKAIVRLSVQQRT
jgi:myosin heavy subunit